MNRIPARTRANFEKLFGKYPFQEGGRFSIVYMMAGSHELKEYNVKTDDGGAYVGEAGDSIISESTVKEQLRHMPEGALRELSVSVEQFKELGWWIRDERALRHKAQDRKNKTEAKENIRAMGKVGAPVSGSTQAALAKAK